MCFENRMFTSNSSEFFSKTFCVLCRSIHSQFVRLTSGGLRILEARGKIS